MSSDGVTMPLAGPRPSRHGRPRKLSHEAVLDAALDLMDTIDPEEFTLAKLAQRLGVSTMSLYTYFPSREALLEAVADRAFHHFSAPSPTGDWRLDIMAWLWAVQRHFDRHPIATKVMSWNGRLPTAWLRVWTPVLRLMHEQGLEGPTLALTFDWFINAAVGLLITQRHAIEISRTASVGDVGVLPVMEAKLLVGMLYDLRTVSREARLETGFRRLVEGLQTCFAESVSRRS